MGTALLSDTDLANFKCNPKELDLVVSNNAMSGLKEANRRGEIENTTLPRDDKLEVVTAQTIFSGAPEKASIPTALNGMKAIVNVQRMRSSMKHEPKQGPSGWSGYGQGSPLDDPSLPMSPPSDLSSTQGRVIDRDVGPEDSLSVLEGDEREVVVHRKGVNFGGVKVVDG